MKPIKVRLREFIRELKCSHNEYTKVIRSCGFKEYVCCECKKCSKAWLE